MGNKIVLWAVLGLLWVGSVVGAAHLAFTKGISDGIDAYHAACYYGIGIIVDEASGTMVQCSPLVLSPQEKNNFMPLDRDKKV